MFNVIKGIAIDVNKKGVLARRNESLWMKDTMATSPKKGIPSRTRIFREGLGWVCPAILR